MRNRLRPVGERGATGCPRRMHRRAPATAAGGVMKVQNWFANRRSGCKPDMAGLLRIGEDVGLQARLTKRAHPRVGRRPPRVQTPTAIWMRNRLANAASRGRKAQVQTPPAIGMRNRLQTGWREVAPRSPTGLGWFRMCQQRFQSLRRLSLFGPWRAGGFGFGAALAVVPIRIAPKSGTVLPTSGSRRCCRQSAGWRR